ncbi:DNA topoisomerase 1 [Blyttiomyces sp. JEL0837]|nr:DNA topoisomerase 1 [Blyttiomyces sp. JEL0837]
MESDDEPLIRSRNQRKAASAGVKKRRADEDDEDDESFDGDISESDKPLAKKRPSSAVFRYYTRASSSSLPSFSVGSLRLRLKGKRKAETNGTSKKAKSEPKSEPKQPASRPNSASVKKEKEPAAAEASGSKKRRKSATADDSDAPTSEPAKKKTAAAKKVKAETSSSAASSPAKKEKGAAKGKGKGKVNGDSGAANGKSGGESDEEDDDYKWWKQGLNDGEVKWKTLEHAGPMFPPEYEPHGVKMKYDGKEVDLAPEAEEVASFYAAILGTDYAENTTFQANFFRDFLEVIKESKKPCPIKEFSKCDFTPIFNYLNEQKEIRKNKTKEEKQYGWAILDGRKEKVGNFRIEPPGLFRGRGNHPKTGTLKLRVKPNQVTINIGADAKVPEAPKGHKWGNIVHDNTVTWLAMWKENVNGSIKYVFLAATSSLKGQSDLKKFEKARGLKDHVGRIRSEYTAELESKVTATRQRATAMYLIDRFALRAGNEKGDDEADTVGCCSLRFEHVTLEPPNKVIFDFLGKDSIRYYNEVLVDEQVFKSLKIFKKPPKKEGDALFDRLTTAILNKHLNTYMAGLTAKVFRTFNASYTFQEELKRTPADGTVAEKILAYNRANRQVAILCNHQRSVSKGHQSQMGKIQDKVRAFKYERREVKKQILELDPKLKKKMPQLVEEESDLDDEFIERHLEVLKVKEEEKRVKALEKENEKRAAEGQKPLKELPDKGKAPAAPNLERLQKKLADLDKKIENTKLQMIDKDENKTTALSTSKINYIDPRISVAWCKKNGVDLEKIFNRSLREKFKWAMDVDGDWQF